ncbi:MAG: shikimate kinase [Psychroserpens sp.]|nr:shikimate kinase [Psychroserpens sp.]
MTIILLGYMGSGKSTVGRKLAGLLNYDFIDLDTYIEKQAQLKIPDLFQKKGEIYFRKLEAKSLAEVLQLKNTVVALGGGTPCYGNNMEAIKKQDGVTSVYLKVSIPELVQRLKTETNNRPLISHLNSEEDLTEFIGKHIFERAPIYEQADLVIQANANSPELVIESILLKLF